MSVVNAWRNGRAGYLFTDTAHLDSASGKVAAFGSKAFGCAEFPAVLGMTMSGGVMPWLLEPFLQSPPRNLAALRRLLPVAVQEFCLTATAHNSPKAYVRAVVVAWCSRTRQIRMLYCSTLPDLGQAFEVCELNYFLGAGINAPAVRAAEIELQAGRSIDAGAGAIALIEEQRRAPFLAEDPALAGNACIGGAIERATVTRDGVEFDVIHQWPDVVGQRINP